jgi:hypothetical protein
MSDAVEYKLEQPIKAHGEDVCALSIRRPTVQEIRAIKVLPYTLNESMMPVFDMEAVCKYLAVCCAIPPGSVNQLGLADLNKLSWALTSFFMPNSSEPSTS